MQSTWLHRLGNLTLTAYNEEYSDRSFEKKRSITHGFDDSPLRLNQYVARQNRWTSEEMRIRGEMLATRALDIWPSLTVSKESLREAKGAQLRASRGKIKNTRGDMDEVAGSLFDALQKRIESFDQEIIEVAAYRSVSYYNRNAEFFCEVLPRTRAYIGAPRNGRWRM